MPQIIVAADRGAAFGEGAVTFRERVNVADFESNHFAAQLLERLGWAVEDADRAEQTPDALVKDSAEQTPDALGEDSAEQTPVAPTPHAERADRTEAARDDIADDREPQPDERLSVPSPA